MVKEEKPKEKNSNSLKKTKTKKQTKNKKQTTKTNKSIVNKQQNNKSKNNNNTNSNNNSKKDIKTKNNDTDNRIWFEKIGYAYNPFTIKPGFFDDAIFGYDEEIDELIKSLNNKSMHFLEGDFGLGKTTILKFIINDFKETKKKVIYISRNRSDRSFNYSKLLKGVNKGINKLLGKKAKNVILIVDETEKINNNDCKQIKQLFDDNYIQSVLFIDISFKEAKLSDEIKSTIGKNIIKLRELTPKDAVELIRDRLEKNENLISDDYIKKIFNISKKNTRQFLLNIEEVCRHAIDNNRTSINKEDLSILY